MMNFGICGIEANFDAGEYGKPSGATFPHPEHYPQF